MSRKDSPAEGITLSGREQWGGAPKKRRASQNPAYLVAALASAAVCTGVSADSLAQPSYTALDLRAADYVRFREDVAAIEATPFDNAAVTRDAHKRFSAHDSDNLSAGWVAYAALVAADSPAFAEALKDEVNSNKRDKNGLKGRDAFLARLSADPSYPRKMKGADEAIARVLSMTAQDVTRFSTLGESFKSQAYAMQRTAWGKARIAGSAERLTEADAFARTRPAAAAPSFQPATSKGVTAPALASASDAWAADWGARGAPGANSHANAQIIMDRVLNLAARYATGTVNDKMVEIYAKNDRSDQCLSMAALTLRQCIAATRAPYEEAFCIGEHALNDVAECVGWVAGAGAPAG